MTMVDPKDDVFDLGCHIGTFAIPLAKKIGSDGRIVVVEALPETFSGLAAREGVPMLSAGPLPITPRCSSCRAPPGSRA